MNSLRPAASRLQTTARTAFRWIEISTSRPSSAISVIHQPGHVGSNTVANSLRTLRPRHRVLHVHRLSGDPTSLGTASYAIDEAVLRRRLRKEDRAWNVITLVRNPIERNVSALLRRSAAALTADGADLGSLQPEELATEAMRRFEIDWVSRENPFDRFFRDELSPCWRLNVMAGDFDPRRRVGLNETGRRRLLTLRSEDLDSHGAQTLTNFLGVNLDSMRSSNRTTAPFLQTARSILQNEVKLPASYVDRMLASEVTERYYSTEERSLCRQKWSR